VKPRTLTLAALICIGGYASANALGQHQRPLLCSTNAGSVVGYLPNASQCGHTVSDTATLYRAAPLGTDGGGQVTFQTPYLYRCKELPSSSDVLLPTLKIALLHRFGKTWCRHRPTDHKTWLQLPGATILTTGTLIGLTSDGKGSTIKLVEGSATVTLTTQHTTRILPPGSQLFVSIRGIASKPTPIVLGPDEQVAVKELQLDVVQMGPPQSIQHLNNRSETAVVVIGQDSATAQKEAAQLGDTKKAILTADQVRARPRLAADELTRIGAHSIITAGSFAALAPIWQLLRSKALIPTDTALLYVAM
jgi:hypothetical protein